MNSIKYFVNLSEGYDSKYNGVDKLFNKESFTKDSLNEGMMLTAAYRYAMDPKNNIDVSITPNEYAALEENINLEDAKVIKGQIIRDAIKVLFGIDYNNKGYSGTGYKYTYTYDSYNDMYVRKAEANSADSNNSILPIVISNSKKDDTIVTKVAIAYVNENGNKYEIYSDSENRDLIKSVEEINIDDFTKKEVDKLSKFNVTCKDVDKNYTFEKIEAVK